MVTVEQKFFTKEGWPFTNPFFAHLEPTAEKMQALEKQIEALKKERDAFQAQAGALKRQLFFARRVVLKLSEWLNCEPGVYLSDVSEVVEAYQGYCGKEENNDNANSGD